MPVQTRAGRTPDSMYVVFRHMRKFVIHNVRQFVDIQAACGDVSGDQNSNFVGLEVRKRFGTCALRLVAVDRNGVNAIVT